MIRSKQKHRDAQKVTPLRYVALWRSTKPASNSFEDEEFGTVSLKRNARSKYVRLRMQQNGELVVMLPTRSAERHAHELVDQSRPAIRKWREKHLSTRRTYADGDKIGYSHTIKFSRSDVAKLKVTKSGLDIVVNIPDATSETAPEVQTIIKPYVAKALQKEARAYLPRRLRYLANEYGYDYDNVRFGTQKGRWGSCSNHGTISLNVGLMELDHSLIDYVLVHELCHTKQMNHSANFWKLVENCLPDYKTRRKTLKAQHPAH